MIIRIILVITRLLIRPFFLKKVPLKLVVIVVPLSTRSYLLADEVVSLRHLCHFCGAYDKFLIVPPNFKLKINSFYLKVFSFKFFGSVTAHNRLLSSPRFYKFFSDYKYIFFYHLDSLVLSDKLEKWCKSGWDYIGAPFVPCYDTPWVKNAHVGNGGFALLNIENALKVIFLKYKHTPVTYWFDLYNRNGIIFNYWLIKIKWLNVFLPRLLIINRLFEEWQKSENCMSGVQNNDMFWSFMACDFLTCFKVATLKDGLDFAFEADPRRCLDLNEGRIPFGCHAWNRYDKYLWKKYLLF